MGVVVQATLRRVCPSPLGTLALLTDCGHSTENRNSRVYRYVVCVCPASRGAAQHLPPLLCLLSSCSFWLIPTRCLPLGPQADCTSILSRQRSPWVESWYQLRLVDAFALSSALGVMVSTCLVFLNQGTWGSQYWLLA